MSKRRTRTAGRATPRPTSEPTIVVDGVQVRESSILKAAAKLSSPAGSNQGRPVNACPICYDGYGGKGREKWRRPASGTLTRINYDCNQCGHNWSADVRTVRVVEAVNWKTAELL